MMHFLRKYTYAMIHFLLKYTYAMIQQLDLHIPNRFINL